MKTWVEHRVYFVHIIYDSYASNKDGTIIDIKKKTTHIYKTNNDNGFMQFDVTDYDGHVLKTYYVHDFVWECFNGFIPKGTRIEHINGEETDNRLCNLKLFSRIHNVNERDDHENKKCVKATDIDTYFSEEKVVYFNSIYAVQQHLRINAGIVKMVCEGLNDCKTGLSIIDKHTYTFEYVEQTDLPDDYKKKIKKSSYEKRIEVLKKEKKCRRCDKTFKKNYYENVHKKKCKNK